jgi:hypothetical protein
MIQLKCTWSKTRWLQVIVGGQFDAESTPQSKASQDAVQHPMQAVAAYAERFGNKIIGDLEVHKTGRGLLVFCSAARRGMGRALHCMNITASL